jgi:hypothetical protein
MNVATVLDVNAAFFRVRSFAGLARMLPWVVGASAAASIVLVEYKVWRTPHFPHVAIVVELALAAFVASLLIAFLGRRLASSWSGTADHAAASWLAAFEIGILLLPVAVVLLARGVPEDQITGWAFPFVNKRWLIALYNIAIATVLVLPVAIERWRSRATSVAYYEAPASVALAPERSWLVVIGGQAVIAALGWFLAGPPWHLERHHRVIDWHEQLHFGPLQAIWKGYLPFVGPAATPYGPGSQMLIYDWMKLSGSFDIVSFRTAWAIQQFIAVLAVGAAACWWLGAIPAVAVLLLSFTYSPIAFFQTAPDGTWAGLYGWSNACRYLGPLLVVPAVAGLAVRRTTVAAVVLLGAVWGAAALLSQENLTSTGTATVLLLVLLCLTRTIPLSRACRVLGQLLVGFACAVLPMLAYFAWHGAAGEFLRTYFFFARAVVAGFSNSWWPVQDGARPDRISYFMTLPFLLGCGVCALWRLPSLALAGPLDHARARFLAFVCVMLVCYQTALLRSDAAHLMNTMIALPFLIVLGVTDLPAWLAPRTASRWAVRVAFVVLVVVVYPTVRVAAQWRRFTVPVARFETPATRGPVETTDSRVEYRRVTPLLANEPRVVDGGTVSMPQYLNFVTDVRSLIGNRKTYFLQIGWTTTGALIAFLGDLDIAPHPLGGELLNLNDEVKASVASDIRMHPQNYEAFIGPSLTDPEARAFLESHPDAQRIERKLGDSTVHILLSRP